MLSDEVGTMNWKACEDCIHSGSEGGCGCPDEDGIYRLDEFVVCGNYKPIDA